MDLSLHNRIQKFSQIITDASFSRVNNQASQAEFEINRLCERILQLKINYKNLYIIGNGGSAAVAAHAVTDFFNVAKIRATTLHESSLLTCLSNDFGYENALEIMLEQLLNPGDIVIAISSSGRSMNIRNASTVSRKKGAFLVTLSGFLSDNPLRILGDINIWVNSCDYGFVEVGHQFILHNIADRLNKKLIG